jgi:hypothetical protein
MTLGILSKVKQRLEKAEWPELTKLCFWSACMLAFWGAFRLGEILKEKEVFFDKFSNLLGEDVQYTRKNLTRRT